MFIVYGKIGDETEFTWLDEFDRYADAEWYIDKCIEDDTAIQQVQNSRHSQSQPVTEYKIHDTAGTLQESWSRA